MAREEGLPVLRATPTGVSAVIDAYGRPAGGLLAPGRRGVLDAALSPASKPTLYSRVRDIPLWLVEIGATLGCLSLRRRPREASPVERPRLAV